MAPTVMYRLAEQRDVNSICSLIKRSINHLCAPDYNYDPEVLKPWLSEIKPEKFKAWIAHEEDYLIVATNEQDQIAGVAMLRQDGCVHLCYVAPEFSKQGVGQILINGLFARARQKNIHHLHLNSTLTAKGFYERFGFKSKGRGFCYGEGNAFKMILDLV